MHLISDLPYFGLYEIEKLKMLTLKKQSLMSEGHWGKNNDLSTSCYAYRPLSEIGFTDVSCLVVKTQGQAFLRKGILNFLKPTTSPLPSSSHPPPPLQSSPFFSSPLPFPPFLCAPSLELFFLGNLPVFKFVRRNS